MLILIVVGATFAFWKTTSPSSASHIRSARQQIDDAFQRHAARQLATLVTADCHFTAPSVHTDGPEALERFYTSLFAKRPDVTLTHHVNRIAVNENWDLASEHGDWIERWTDKDGLTELRGIYLTMWKRDGRYWREYSETVVPETCTGSSYCRQK